MKLADCADNGKMYQNCSTQTCWYNIVKPNCFPNATESPREIYKALSYVLQTIEKRTTFKSGKQHTRKHTKYTNKQFTISGNGIEERKQTQRRNLKLNEPTHKTRLYHPFIPTYRNTRLQDVLNKKKRKERSEKETKPSTSTYIYINSRRVHQLDIIHGRHIQMSLGTKNRKKRKTFTKPSDTRLEC